MLWIDHNTITLKPQHRIPWTVAAGAMQLVKTSVLRALREQRPDPWEETVAGARPEDWYNSFWRRLCLRALIVIRAVASSLILGEFENIRQEHQRRSLLEHQRRSLLAVGFTGQEATLGIEAGQKSGLATAHPRLKEYHGPTGRGKAMSISQGKFPMPAEQCEHPTESVKARGNSRAVWWTCALCGSRSVNLVWWTVTSAVIDQEMVDETEEEGLELARNITAALRQQGASQGTAFAAVAHALKANRIDRRVHSLPL